jgi:hypothetical protein
VGIRYATREQIKAAANINGAGEDARVDRLNESASRDIERELHRIFYPKIETRYYDWPDNRQGATSIYVDGDLRSVTTLAILAQGTPEAIAATDYFLSPANDGPPYNKIEIDTASDAAFEVEESAQRNISVAGVWGFSADSEAAGALAEALDSSETDVDVTDSSKIGVGDLILVGTERMVVTDKALLTTTATLNGGIAGDSDVVTVTIDSGAKVKRGEIVTVDAERMLVEDIAGNNLIVTRAYDGSVLAAHLTGVTVYAPRTLTVERAAAGTTAAAHDTATAITRNVPTAKITTLVIAEAIAVMEQEKSGYARNIGQGDGAQEFRAIGLQHLRDEVKRLYTNLRGVI